jgi:AcrR family transcriptional regulator
VRRTKEEAAETRESIVAAAIRVFAEKGFNGASLSGIAGEAGVTRGAIYWHFKNKEMLFEELLQRMDSYHVHLVERGREEAGTPRGILRNVLREVIRRQIDDPEWRMMQEIIVRDYLNRRGNIPWMDSNSRGDEAAVGYFRELIDAGTITSFSDGVTAFVAVSCFVSGWIIQSIELGNSLGEVQIEELVDFAVRGFFGNTDGEEVR